MDKLFGPAVFDRLRITPDPSRGWVIERESSGLGPMTWIEQCLLPAYLDIALVKESCIDE